MPEYTEDPRYFWTPAIGFHFGIKPFEMVDVTGDEYRRIAHALSEMEKESAGG